MTAIANLGLKAKILTHTRCHMDDARIAVETGVDGLDVVIGTSSYLREFSHGKDMDYSGCLMGAETKGSWTLAIIFGQIGPIWLEMGSDVAISR